MSNYLTRIAALRVLFTNQLRTSPPGGSFGRYLSRFFAEGKPVITGRVKMRMATALLRSRVPQNEANVPFQEVLPLRLKSQVSGKTDKTSDVACLQEMAVLFSCLKTNDFNESLCAKEVGGFQRCYKVYLDKKMTKKETSSKGVLVAGKDLNYKQLNKVLKKYPTSSQQ